MASPGPAVVAAGAGDRLDDAGPGRRAAGRVSAGSQRRGLCDRAGLEPARARSTRTGSCRPIPRAACARRGPDRDRTGCRVWGHLGAGTLAAGDARAGQAPASVACDDLGVAGREYGVGAGRAGLSFFSAPWRPPGSAGGDGRGPGRRGGAGGGALRGTALAGRRVHRADRPVAGSIRFGWSSWRGPTCSAAPSAATTTGAT
jgi:hypothetical protein